MTDHLSFPASWYPLCRSSELKRRQVVGLEAFGFDLAVFRTISGKVVALQAQCVHMGADLSRGRVIGGRLQCPLTEWECGSQGLCEYIPATTEIPERARLGALPCEEHYGLVFAFLGGKPSFAYPCLEESDQYLYSAAYSMEFDTPYQVLAANSFDSLHFASLHQRTLLEPPFVHSASTDN